MGRREGIDVSHWNASINWGAVKAAGVFWGSAKVSEGTGYTDPTGNTNRAGMKAAGIKYRLLYHYGLASNTPDAEAGHFLTVIGSLEEGEGVMLDAEDPPGLTAAWCTTWCQRVESFTNRPVAVYCGAFYSNLWKNTTLFNGTRARILANYNSEQAARNQAFPYWGDAWQYTGSGSVPGVVGDCDLDQVDNPGVFDTVCGLGGGGGSGAGGGGGGASTGHPWPYPPDQSSGNWRLNLPNDAGLGEVLVYDRGASDVFLLEPFDDFTSAGWGGSGAWQILPGGVIGTYAATVGTNTLIYNLPGDMTWMKATFWYRAQAASTTAVVQFRDAFNANHFTLAVNTTGRLTALNGGLAGTPIGNTAAGAIVPGTWYQIVVEQTLSTTTGIINASLDGVPFATGTALDTIQGNGTTYTQFVFSGPRTDVDELTLQGS